MGYRTYDKPPKPEDHLRKFAVRNGAIVKLAFGCYYLEPHNVAFHDHIGWPNPDNADHICQERNNLRFYGWPGMSGELDEIHLIEEGYTEAAVSYEDEEQAAHLITEAWIDEEVDNIVYMKVKADYPTFNDKPLDLRFTLFVKKHDGSAIDAVCHGFISVLPGASYPEE